MPKNRMPTTLLKLRHPVRWFGRVARLAAFTLLALIAGNQAAWSEVLPAHAKDVTLGVVTCASALCHGSIAPWPGSPVAQNEYVVWSRLDKHAGAYKLLLNAQSKAIAAKLGLPQLAHQSAICLDCHTHNPITPPGPKHQVSDGVSCEACHGPSERWLAGHTAPDASHASNVAAGLFPVEQPLQRAELCLSCHLGAKDKVVTHRIMAAGHPRLSFELNTFTQLQPSHAKAKPATDRPAHAGYGVQVWALGQAVAVKAQLDLLTDPVRGRDGAFPELTLFDCHACHHPMADTRWTSKSAFGPRTAPGLVRLNDASMVMLRQILRQTDPALGERFGTAVAQLHQALAGQGNLASSATTLKDLATAAAQSLQRRPVTPGHLRAMALTVIDEGLQGNYSDYVSAEQASMALGSMGNALAANASVTSVAALNQALTRLRATLKADEQYHAEDFKNRLRQLRPLLAGNTSKP